MAEKRIIVKAEGGKTLFGSDFHILEDESITTMKTDDMKSFKKYINGGSVLYYNADGCEAFLKSYNRWGDPFAVLNLEKSISLRKVKNMNGKDYCLASFEEFLNEMKPFLDENALDLLSHIRDFRVSKITKMVRKKERNGNYHFMISKESSENEDFVPPEAIGFKVPVFEHMDHEIKIDFELFFDFKMSGDDVGVFFKLTNPLIVTEIAERQRAIIENELEELTGCAKLWGSLQSVVRTDSWKYKSNTVNF